MAKGMHVGVGGTARKVKKMYVGVGGVAREVKEAYIGVGGVARPFWTGGELYIPYARPVDKFTGTLETSQSATSLNAVLTGPCTMRLVDEPLPYVGWFFTGLSIGDDVEVTFQYSTSTFNILAEIHEANYNQNNGNVALVKLIQYYNYMNSDKTITRSVTISSGNCLGCMMTNKDRDQATGRLYIYKVTINGKQIFPS